MNVIRPVLLALLLSVNSVHAAMQNPYALVFFFDSTCAYCHRLAPKVQQASLDFALPIYAFSINGQGIPGFEVPIPVTHDIATTFFPQTTQPVMPATFLLNVNSRKFAKLSIGDVAQRQLNQSIQQVLNDLTLQKALQ